MADKKDWTPNPGSVAEYFKKQGNKKSDWESGAAEYEMDPKGFAPSVKTNNALAGKSLGFMTDKEKEGLSPEKRKEVEAAEKAGKKRWHYGETLNRHAKAKKAGTSLSKDYHQHSSLLGPGDVTIKDNLMSHGFTNMKDFKDFKELEREGKVEFDYAPGALANLALLWSVYHTDNKKEALTDDKGEEEMVDPLEEALVIVGQDVVDNPSHYGTYAAAFKGNKSLMNFLNAAKHGGNFDAKKAANEEDLDDTSNPVPDPNDTDWETDDDDEEKLLAEGMPIDKVKEVYAEQEKLEAKEAKEAADMAEARAKREQFEADIAQAQKNMDDIKAQIAGKEKPSEKPRDNASGFIASDSTASAIGNNAAEAARAQREWNKAVKENPALGRSFPLEDYNADWTFDPEDYDKDLYKLMSNARYKSIYPAARKNLENRLKDMAMNPALKGTPGYTDSDISDLKAYVAKDELGRAKHKAAESARVSEILDELSLGESMKELGGLEKKKSKGKDLQDALSKLKGMRSSLAGNPSLKGTEGYTDDDFNALKSQLGLGEQDVTDKDLDLLQEKFAADDKSYGDSIEKLKKQLGYGVPEKEAMLARASAFMGQHPEWNLERALRHRNLWEWDRQRLLKRLRAQEAEEQREKEGLAAPTRMIEAADPDNLQGKEDRMTYGDLAGLARQMKNWRY